MLRSCLPWRLRAQYLLSASYFLSGWTVLVYMALPVVRILTGAQPIAGASADSFLAHFAPYVGRGGDGQGARVRSHRERAGASPDWSVVGDAPTDASPAPSPSGDSPRYGFEATRALVACAVDCNPIGRHIATAAWPFFLGELEAGRLIVAVYDLDGQPLTDYEHPTALVAAAAAADAAGADAEAAGLLDRAGELDLEHPTYYGAAWVALGRLWLDTDRLGGCPP